MSKLGPIQKKWVESLRAHPERQTDGVLGRKNEDGTYGVCCLGEGGLIAGACKWVGNVLYSSCMNSNETLTNTYKILGLRSEAGWLRKEVDRDDESFNSLAEMNDGGWTWPEIADYIEANPDNVFERFV